MGKKEKVYPIPGSNRGPFAFSSHELKSVIMWSEHSNQLSQWDVRDIQVNLPNIRLIVYMSTYLPNGISCIPRADHAGIARPGTSHPNLSYECVTPKSMTFDVFWIASLNFPSTMTADPQPPTQLATRSEITFRSVHSLLSSSSSVFFFSVVIFLSVLSPSH